MKPKDFCQECGHLIARKKLHLSRKSNKLLCGNCYRVEQDSIFKLNKAPVMPEIEISTNSTENPKSIIRMAKNRQSVEYLTNEETMMLRKKYGYDSFVAGNKKCREIRRLKRAIYDTQMKKELSKNLEEHRTDKDKNKKFLDGLYD